MNTQGFQDRQVYPLTSYQRDIWIEQVLEPNDPFYNIGGSMELEGETKLEIFQKVLDWLSEEQDVLRMIIVEEEGEPMQKIMNRVENRVIYHDFSEKENPRSYSEEWIIQNFQEPFELDQLLFKVYLIRVEKDLHICYSKAHHLIADGWAYSMLFKNLLIKYKHLAKGLPPEVNCWSYRDFILEHEHYLKSRHYQRDEEFWKKQLEQIPTPLFDLKKTHNSRANNETKTASISIPREDYNRINKFCQDHALTTFHFLLAALFLCCRDLFQKESMVIGIPTLNRKGKKYKDKNLFS